MTFRVVNNMSWFILSQESGKITLKSESIIDLPTFSPIHQQRRFVTFAATPDNFTFCCLEFTAYAPKVINSHYQPKLRPNFPRRYHQLFPTPYPTSPHTAPTGLSSALPRPTSTSARVCFSPAKLES